MPNVDEMWRGVRDSVTVRRVYGKPIESDGVTVIPAAVVHGGAGGGGDNEGNGGGGFGVGARPIGAYVIRNGKVSWRPAFDLNRVLLIVAALAYLIVRRR
jgi:uncharacterized spore protein YtfJ